MAKVYIIAEAGVNHNGDIELAKKLIDAAAAAKVDAIKFQTFNSAKLVSIHAKKADYQKENSSGSDDQLSMLQQLELSQMDHEILIKYCKDKNIQFLSSAFDDDSLCYLIGLGIEPLKIPSGEITNLPYLRKIGALNKKIILSTGMSNLDEIRDALTILRDAGTLKEKITILHCNTEYPTPFMDVNLLAMNQIKNQFGIEIGYSDHTPGIHISLAAIALGATIIEKHFTLDKNLPGPDHKASLNPKELTELVMRAREIEVALGDGIKRASPSEQKNIDIARKSIVAACDIKAGEVFSKANLTTKRPGSGISPMKWDQIIGKVASINYKEDDLIEL